MLVYYMVCILTHFWLSFVPKWSIFKLLGDYRYLSIMKPQIIDNSLIATLRSAISNIFFGIFFLVNFFLAIGVSQLIWGMPAKIWGA
jgi:hypothetical protein